ncbi:MAG: hypothetical protein HMLKMBBP_02295 [Planctomycetes bacterium]|nr:hypothetical protein [Planctomycetota bacterium]
MRASPSTAASHTATPRDPHDVEICLPSGENVAAAAAGSVERPSLREGPCRTWRSAPVAASSRRSVPSSGATKTVLPSGLTATATGSFTRAPRTVHSGVSGASGSHALTESSIDAVTTRPVRGQIAPNDDSVWPRRTARRSRVSASRTSTAKSARWTRNHPSGLRSSPLGAPFATPSAAPSMTRSTTTGTVRTQGAGSCTSATSRPSSRSWRRRRPSSAWTRTRGREGWKTMQNAASTPPRAESTDAPSRVRTTR